MQLRYRAYAIVSHRALALLAGGWAACIFIGAGSAADDIYNNYVVPQTAQLEDWQLGSRRASSA